MPSAPPCGMSTSALKLNDESRMDGASPFGVPVISPDQENSVRPAARLGRGWTSRVAAEESRGRTWYLFASTQNSFSSSLSLSGYLSATLSYCVQSLVRSYSSYGKPAGSLLTRPAVIHGGRTTLGRAIHRPCRIQGCPTSRKNSVL